MKTQILTLALPALSLAMLACCSGCRKAQTAVAPAAEAEYTEAPVQQIGAGFRDSKPHGAQMMPKALAYKTNGDYRLNVPITLNSSRTEIVSYPAPTDINIDMAPVELADGWLLDRRGVSENSAFTTYTYSEYASLSQAPTIEQLLGAVIPDARVTAVQSLPMTLTEALADTAAVNKLLRSL